MSNVADASPPASMLSVRPSGNCTIAASPCPTSRNVTRRGRGFVANVGVATIQKPDAIAHVAADRRKADLKVGTTKDADTTPMSEA